MKFNKILVTGADGFIGSHLSEYLIRQGYNVRAFVLYNSFNSWGWLDTVSRDVRDSLDIFTGDVRDPNGVRIAVQGCDAILHLAALIAIPYSYHSPDTYVDTNIRGTLNILQAARDVGVSKIVQTSTSEVYGTAQFVPITEQHPLHPQSPYAATKVAADQLALSFHRSFDLPVAVIRPFNTYGPRQSARAVIPTIITQIAKGKTTLHLGALSPTRDFSYVMDTVRAFESVLCASEAVGKTLNAGSGFEISIGDTARMIADIMQTDVQIICDDERLRPANSEVERLWADTSQLRSVTNWQPEYGSKEGFRNGLRKTVAWFSNQNNLSRYKADIYNM